MIISEDKLGEIYNILNEHFSKEGIKYKPFISKKYLETVNKENLPLIVLEETHNALYTRTLGGNESISSCTYTLNIYAVSKKYNNVLVSDIEIARYLMKEVDKVMNELYKMRRIFSQPTPNIDNSIYRITMRYDANVFDTRGRFL